MTTSTSGAVPSPSGPVPRPPLLVIVRRADGVPGAAELGPLRVGHGHSPAHVAAAAAADAWGPPHGDPAEVWSPSLVSAEAEGERIAIVYEAVPGLPAALDSLDPDDTGLPRVQRPGAYAIALDPARRVLLTRLTGDGRWSLPGGGIDPGESPADAVRREAYEEAGVDLTDVRLVEVDSEHIVGPSPRGVEQDFHAVRFIHRAEVASDAVLRVVEIGGSTDAAAWFAPHELDDALLVPFARTMVHRWAPPRWG